MCVLASFCVCARASLSLSLCVCVGGRVRASERARAHACVSEITCVYFYILTQIFIEFRSSKCLVPQNKQNQYLEQKHKMS